MSEITPATGTSRPTRREIVIAIAASLVRLAFGVLLVLAMLTLLPTTADGGIVAPLAVAVVGTVIYALFSRRQIRKITHSKFPQLMAAEALVFLAAMFLAVFASIYVAISLSNPDSFTEPLDAFTSYYFALTVLATVGFGDITPVTTTARAVTMVQMALDLVFIAVLIRVVSTAAHRGLQRRVPPAQGESAG